MEREQLSTRRKALRINLDQNIYGTFAEIGAGQEVARNFFLAGGASGTIAKTMSAYDMAFSDAIYGESENRRYVSQDRLMKMLDHEYELLEERLVDEEYAEKKFFAFANTITALDYHKKNDPNGWLGVRFQTSPKGEFHDLILHVRLLDNTTLLQHQALGTLGVNLVYAAFFHHADVDTLIDVLMDNLDRDRIAIDMIKVNGPEFDNQDNRLLSLSLVRKGMTDAAIFGPDGEVCQPKDVLYKKNILVLRGRFRPVTLVHLDMLSNGLKQFMKQPEISDEPVLVLSELSLRNIEYVGEDLEQDFLDRVDILCALGHTVLISNIRRHHKLVKYLNDKCKPSAIGLIVGIMNLMELFNEEYYSNFQGEVLKAFGEMFANQNVKMLVYPYQPSPSNQVVTTENLSVHESISHLYGYLVDNGFMEDIKNFDPTLLSIFSDDVIEQIKNGDENWVRSVPQEVAKLIKEKYLFNYPRETVSSKG